MSASGDTVSLRLKLRYPNLDAFIERYAENVSSAGLFLRTKAPKPTGTRIRFELSLADETPVLVGVGVVVAVRTEAPEGMAVRFRELEGDARAVVDRIVAIHGNGSLAPTPLSLDLGGGASSSLDAWGSAEWSTADVARASDWSDPVAGGAWPSGPAASAPVPTPLEPSAATPAPGPTTPEPTTPEPTTPEPAAPEPAAPEPAAPDAEGVEAPLASSSTPTTRAPSEAEPPGTPKKRIASIGLVPAGQLPPRREGRSAPPTDDAAGARTTASTPEVAPPTPRPDQASDSGEAPAPWEAEPTTTFSETPFEVDVVSHLSGIETPDPEGPLAASLPPFEFDATPEAARATVEDTPLPAADPADELPTGDVAPRPKTPALEPAPPIETNASSAAALEPSATRPDDEAPTGDVEPAAPRVDPASADAQVSGPSTPPPSRGPGDLAPAEPAAPAPPMLEPEPSPPELTAPAAPTPTPLVEPTSAPVVEADAAAPPVEVTPPDTPVAAPPAEPEPEPEVATAAPPELDAPPPAPAKPAEETGPRRRNVVERITADLDAQPASKDLPVEMALAIGMDLGSRWVRGGYIERGEMRWLTLGSSVPWSALVASRPDGTLAVGPRARRIADTTPNRAISPMEVLTSMKDGAPADRFPISGWSAEGGVVTLGEHRFEFYDVLLAFARGVRETFLAELPRDEFKAFMALPAALEAGAAGLLRSAVREAGFEHPEFQPMGESLVRAFGLDDRSVDDVLIVHVEETHTLVAVAQRSGRHLTVTSSEVLRDVSTQAIDEAAIELVLDTLTEQHGEDHRDDPVAVRRIEEALDFARSDLRRSPTIDLRITLSSSGGAAGVGVERTVQLSRSLLFSKTEALAGALHERILALLTERQIEPASVGAVIVSGPGGVYPPFGQVVERLCEQPPLGSLPAPLALAVGLARWGRNQTQSAVAKRPDTLDASVGIELPGGRFRPLLPAGAQLPLRFKRQQPVRPHAGQVELRLHQGDSEYVKGCRYLGALVIGPIQADDQGTIKIELEMEVDVDGVLKARIAEPFSGLTGHLVTATQQTPEERKKTMPPPPTRPPPPAPTAGEASAADGGFLKRLFGRRG